MNSGRILGFLLFVAAALACHGQEVVQLQPVPRTPQELDLLLAPIALYPDPLLAIILPSATAPGDVVLAARYVRSKKAPLAIDSQKWDAPVKALARYPEILQMMDDKLDWTSDLGDAFLQQPGDVMNAIQRLRAQALRAGNLVATPQQQVIVEREIIYVVPADPQVIYVPVYDPQVVYVWVERGPRMSRVTFGGGCQIGVWLRHDCDWHNHQVRSWREEERPKWGSQWETKNSLTNPPSNHTVWMPRNHLEIRPFPDGSDKRPPTARTETSPRRGVEDSGPVPEGLPFRVRQDRPVAAPPTVVSERRTPMVVEKPRSSQPGGGVFSSPEKAPAPPPTPRGQENRPVGPAPVITPGQTRDDAGSRPR